jgi:hypothetical protein
MDRICTILFGAALFAATTALTPPPPAGGMPEPGQGPAEPAPPPPPMAPMAAPSASATTDPRMLARAKDWFARLQSGNIDRSQLATNANGALTDSAISNARSMLSNLGTPASFVQQQAGSQGGVNYAVYLLTFRNGTKLNFFFAVDQQGKIEGLQLGHPQ